MRGFIKFFVSMACWWYGWKLIGKAEKGGQNVVDKVFDWFSGGKNKK